MPKESKPLKQILVNSCVYIAERKLLLILIAFGLIILNVYLSEIDCKPWLKVIINIIGVLVGWLIGKVLDKIFKTNSKKDSIITKDEYLRINREKIRSDYNKIVVAEETKRNRSILPIEIERLNYQTYDESPLRQTDFYCHLDKNKFNVLYGKRGMGKSITLKHYACQKAEEDGENVVFSLSLGEWKSTPNINDWIYSTLQIIKDPNNNKEYKITKEDIESILGDRNRNIYIILDGFDEIQDVEYKAVEKFKLIKSLNPDYNILLSGVTGSFPKCWESIKENRKFEVIGFDRNFVEEQLLAKGCDRKIFGTIERPRMAVLKEPIHLYSLLALEDKEDIHKYFNKGSDIDDTDSCRYYLTENYIEKIFKDNGVHGNEKEEIKNFLEWIANYLPVFFSSLDFQPSVLSSYLSKKTYIFLSRIVCAIALSLSIGLLFSSPLDYILLGLLVGITVSIMYLLKHKKENKREDTISQSKRKEIIKIIRSKAIMCLLKHKKEIKTIWFIAIYFLIIGLLLVFYTSLMSPRQESDMVWMFSRTNTRIGITFTFYFAVFFGIRATWQNFNADIRMRFGENLINKVARFLTIGSIGGLIIGIICAAIGRWVITMEKGSFYQWLYDFQQSSNVPAEFIGFFSGFAIGLIGCGLLGSNLFKITVQDNENEITTSFIGLLIPTLLTLLKTTFFLSVLYSIPLFFYYRNVEAVVEGSTIGFSLALFIMLWYGGFDIIEHLILKAVLFCTEEKYRKYNHYLEKAIELKKFSQNRDKL